MDRRAHRSPPALAAACLLAGCLLAENPAYKLSDAEVSTSSGAEGDSTGEPLCPDGQPPRDWYPDLDEDGYGDRKAEPITACDPPTGHLEDHGDCKDDVPSIHPMATEVCNDRDDNCDALIDGKQCGACKVQTTEEYVYWICPVPDGEPAYDWTTARARCNAFGNAYPVDFASVHDLAEYTLIVETVQSYLKQGTDGRTHAWIGLTERPDQLADCGPPDPKSAWAWSDKTPVDYPRWNPMEPSGQQSCMCGDPMCQPAACVEISIDVADSEYGWNDTPCDDELVRGFVCKGERDPDLFPDIGS